MKLSMVILFVFLTGNLIYAQQPEALIKKTLVAPVIDGLIDEVWANANTYDIYKRFQNELPTLGEFGETNWKALWNDQGIFVFLTVNDDAWYPSYNSGGNDWDYDKPEIYFDVNYLLRDGIGPSLNQGHYHISPAAVESKIDGTPTTENNGVVWAIKVENPNYFAEYFIPFSILKDKNDVRIDLTGQIGFDVTIIDRDNDDPARKRAVWSNVGNIDESWVNMDDCGKITLEDAEATTYIESINLTGGTISVDNASLQINAAILPENATVKELKWSVITPEGSSGRASISQTGLLTPIQDGIVTVKAQAMDGSWVEGSVDVAISGQIPTAEELNIIRNGNFDLVYSNGFPAYWGGWVDTNYGDLQQSVDGVVVLNNTKIHPTEYWHYQFWQAPLRAFPDIPYIVSFVAWADNERTIRFDFEDGPINNYNRYGRSSDPESIWGRSEWSFVITTEPKRFTFNVTFDQIQANTIQKMDFMLSQDIGKVYLDSILVISESDLNLVTDSVPKVTTSEVISISTNSAVSGGSITSDGGGLVTARGLCLSTLPNPTIADSKTQDGSGIGSFTSSITGLTANTTYHVRAYATNSLGTGYGADVTFTTMEATGPGSIFRDDFTDLSQWILYGSPEPLNPSNIFERTGVFDNNGDPNYSSGAISKATYSFTGNTKIVSEVYLDFSNLEGCWNSASFGVANPEYKSWGGYDANLIFSLTAVGDACWGSPAETRRHAYFSGGYYSSTGYISFGSDNLINADNYINKWVTMIIEIDNNGIPAFYINDTLLYKGIEPVTTSILTASLPLWLGDRSSGSAGKAYHDNIEIFANAEPFVSLPLVSTSTVTEITTTTAVSGGNVTSDGGATVTARGICWSTSENPTVADNKTSDGNGIGAFTSNLTGLISGTTYNVRAYATNSAGTGYGENITFKTKEAIILNGRLQIIFTQTVNDKEVIFLANNDFSEIKQLTTDSVNSWNPRISHDGTRITYYSGTWPTDLDIWVMNADGSNKIKLTNFGGDFGWCPSWHNNDQSILYQWGSSTEEQTIRMINADGTEDQELFNNYNDKDLQPFMNPVDANKIVYYYDAGNWAYDSQIKIRDLTTGTDELLVDNNNWADGNITYSHDGQNVIWTEHEFGSQSRLQIVNVGTKAIQAIETVTGDFRNINGVFSPDDKELYYTRRSTTVKTEVVRCNVDGTNPVVLFSGDLINWIEVGILDSSSIPIANAGSDQTIEEGTTVTLDGTLSYGIEGDSLSYVWTAPFGIELSDASSPKPSFTAPNVLVDTDYLFSLVVNDGTNDSKIDSVIITVLNIPCPQHFHTVWEGTSGSDHMNINVIGAQYDGIALEPGDEIGVFDGDKCVGYGKLTGPIDLQNILSVKVSRDDGTGNGFAVGNEVTYRIWDCSSSAEYHVQDATCYDTELTIIFCSPFEASGTSYVELWGRNQECLTLSYRTGWNLFSVPVEMDTTNMLDVFQSMVASKSLVKIQDELGSSLENWGIFGGWKNNIGDVKLTEGYKIKVTRPDSLSVCGTPASYPYAIPLQLGWNIIGYPQMGSYDASAVMQQLIDSKTLIKVQDELGSSLENWGIFGGWKNNIGSFNPGEGYKVKVKAKDTLWIYSSYPKSATVEMELLATNHLSPNYESNGVDHMNINLVELPVNMLREGDELGVFDGEACVGAVQLTQEHLTEGTAQIIASANDGQSDGGFTEGRPFRMKLWSSLNGQEYSINSEILQGTPVFAKHETTVASLEKYMTTGFESLAEASGTTVRCYPNPFSDEVTIEIATGAESEITVTVLNQLGQEVSHLASPQIKSAGLHRVKWDGTNSSGQRVLPGMYHLRIRLGETEYHQKLVLSE